MPRFTELTEATMTPRQREVAAAVGAGARGGLRGRSRLAAQPGMAEAFQRAGPLPALGNEPAGRLSELAILVTAARWKARYEWFAHPQAGDGGRLDPAIAEACGAGAASRHGGGRGGRAPLSPPSCTATATYPDAAFDEAKRRFGEQGRGGAARAVRLLHRRSRSR
jgi:4-carboxymuconolactone decarboxylase